MNQVDTFPVFKNFHAIIHVAVMVASSALFHFGLLLALATGPTGSEAVAEDEAAASDLFGMTNRLHGYVDDARCDAMAERIGEAERDVRELDPRKHLAGVWVSAE